MSVRYGLLALLQNQPMYGYQLRAEFEARTGGTWPLNVGQVYTTLGRLERDGLVEASGEDEDGHVHYRLTDAGRDEAASWWCTPVPRESRPRDELAIKLALAITVEGVDVAGVVQAQRTDTMRALQELTRLKASSPDRDLAWSLVVDALIFQAEAEVRWLDHCEGRLHRSRAAGERANRSPGTRDDGGDDAAPAPPQPRRSRARAGRAR